MDIEQFKTFIENNPEYNEYINLQQRIANSFHESYFKYHVNKDKSWVEEYVNYYKHEERSKYLEI